MAAVKDQLHEIEGDVKAEINAAKRGKRGVDTRIPRGVGKSFIASALAHAACRADYSVRSYRLPRLVEELTRHRAQANVSAFLKQLAKVDLLYIDDFGLPPLADQSKRDRLEIPEDRYDKKSTLITSQLPIEQ